MKRFLPLIVGPLLAAVLFVFVVVNRSPRKPVLDRPAYESFLMEQLLLPGLVQCVDPLGNFVSLQMVFIGST